VAKSIGLDKIYPSEYATILYSTCSACTAGALVQLSIPKTIASIVDKGSVVLANSRDMIIRNPNQFFEPADEISSMDPFFGIK